eukprot:CAMPEP_0184502648 /NCGR_PEP_ID=MMETSP0113_2-20130426/50907_1 /TAXON_ID=91329 /ORGANISM="Norrisiella sphaerica, Strain BC52" /LENGTH=146 /DNA_ID=CAMNT_0026891917 /DNA_START=123 /DNA_END=563 /DNA_ORIENTATION=+
MMVDGRVVNLGLWDTAGQEDYDRLRPLAYPMTDIFLIVYSVTNQTSLKNVWQKWAPEIRDHSESANIILVGNKCDLREDKKYLSKNKLIGKDEGKEVAEKIGAIAYHECSALTQEGLKELFDDAVRIVLKQRKEAQKKRRKLCTIM